MIRIVSSLPGRIRLRDPALRRAAPLERLRAVLAAIDGVLSVQSNALAGSLVLRYDVARVAQAAIESQVEAAANPANPASLVLAASPRPRPDHTYSVKRRINRYAKYGMLGSLAVSLAFATAGKKRWHVASGGLFLVCLGAHVVLHRRHLLR